MMLTQTRPRDRTRLLSAPGVADTWTVSGSAASLARAPRVGLPARMLSDERLARMVAEGSTRAFAQLHERHAGALYRYCRSIVRHDQDAQDVLQTTMARALAALAKGPPDAPLRP